MSRKAESGLNEKQEMFCQEYLVDLNATQAAIRAGYSAATAQEKASALRSDPKVAARIQELQSERSKKTGIDAEYVLARVTRIGRKAEKAKQYHAALKAWELVGKHIDMFISKHEHTGKDGAPIQFSDHEAAAKLAAIMNAARERKDGSQS